MNKRLVVFSVACIFFLSSCAHKNAQKTENSSEAMSYVMNPGNPPSSGLISGGIPAGKYESETRRFIAVSHQLTVEIPEGELVKAWEATIKFCRILQCEVLSSSITGQTPESAPDGELSLRIVPGNADKFFEFLKKSTTILEHKTASEDKTDQVVDAEAGLKNKTELRDRLRSLLAKAPANLKDLIELEKELANIQSEIDALATMRKVLANETEKVAIQISFRAKRTASRTGVLAPIVNALHDSMEVLATSFGALINFIFYLLPWLLIIVPLIWLIERFLHRQSRKAKASAKEKI